MSAWEERRHPWLNKEKRFLEAFIAGGKPLLGVCLGAQILAEVLGSRAYAGPHKEIGWFVVTSTPEGRETWLSDTLPDHFETFLWHGDTFDLPEGAVRLGRSAAFENQGFVWNQTLALQFHLEVHPDWVQMLAKRDAEQLVRGPYIQTAEAIVGKPASLYRANNALMDSLLERWLVRVRS
jgi:GMP synthase-like glutamine amidotransferase